MAKMTLKKQADEADVAMRLQEKGLVVGRQLADGKYVLYKPLAKMRPTTAKRYSRIRKAFGELAGTMPAMHIYARLAEQFDLSEERVRKILAKKMRPPNNDWLK